MDRPPMGVAVIRAWLEFDHAWIVKVRVTVRDAKTGYPTTIGVASSAGGAADVVEGWLQELIDGAPTVMKRDPSGPPSRRRRRWRATPTTRRVR